MNSSFNEKILHIRAKERDIEATFLKITEKIEGIERRKNRIINKCRYNYD